MILGKNLCSLHKKPMFQSVEKHISIFTIPHYLRTKHPPKLRNQSQGDSQVRIHSRLCLLEGEKVREIEGDRARLGGVQEKQRDKQWAKL